MAAMSQIKFVQVGDLPSHVRQLVHYRDGSKTMIFNTGQSTKCPPTNPVHFRTRDKVITRKFIQNVPIIRRVMVRKDGTVTIFLHTGETRDFPVRNVSNGLRTHEPHLRHIVRSIAKEFEEHDIRGTWGQGREISNMKGADADDRFFQIRRDDGMNAWILYYDDGEIVHCTAESPKKLVFSNGIIWER